LNDLKFDEMTKAMSETTSRRQALKLLVTSGAGGMLALVGAGGAQAIAPGRCRKNGTVCRQHIECCSEFCDPATLQCACTPGAEVCPGTGACVPACTGTQVFNPETCRCECPAGTTPCGSTCCTSTQTCTSGVCCQNPTTCSQTSDCCPESFCNRGPKGELGVCQPCAGLMCDAKTGTGCCEGFVCLKGVCVPQFTV
jgi:CXCXC repeat